MREVDLRPSNMKLASVSCTGMGETQQERCNCPTCMDAMHVDGSGHEGVTSCMAAMHMATMHMVTQSMAAIRMAAGTEVEEGEVYPKEEDARSSAFVIVIVS
jgi:hypothetical protein